MKIFLTTLTYAVCVAFFFGCKRSENKSTDATVITFDNYQPRTIEVDSYFADIKIVPLETNEKGIFSHVAQIELVDSLLFVSDLDNLCLFNIDGEFISKIGRQGRGPGEYSVLKGFFVDADKATVSIIDDGNGGILTYGFDGKHIASKEIPGAQFSWGYSALLADDEKVLIVNRYNPIRNMAYSVVDIRRPERVDFFNTYDPVKLENYSYHFAQHPMTRSGNKIHLTMPLDHTVYEYSDGEVYPKYHIETPQEMIPKERIDGAAGPGNSYFSQIIDLTIDGYFGGFTDIFETDDSIFLHYMAKGAYPGLYVMDKNAAKGEYFLYPSAIEQLKSPVFPFSASDGNTLVSLVPVHQAMFLKIYIGDGEEVSADMRDALSRMDESSNPMLVVYTLKD